MIDVHHDPWFPFRFAEDRIIPRFHLEGAWAGRRVSVIKIDPGTGERLGLLATATVGEGG
jgi:putative acetyltransferase